MENLIGLIEQRQGHHAPAAVAFDREAEFYRNAHLYRDMTRALARAGSAYEAASQPAVAAERYHRAARSALGQNDRINAARYLDNALTNAAKSGDKQMIRRAQALANEMRPSTQPGEVGPASRAGT